MNVQSNNAVLSLQLSMKQFPNGSQIDIADNVFLVLALEASGVSKCIAYIFITKCCSCGFSNSLIAWSLKLPRVFSSTAQCRQKAVSKTYLLHKVADEMLILVVAIYFLLLFSFLQDSEVKYHCIQCIFCPFALIMLYICSDKCFYISAKTKKVVLACSDC